MDLHIFFLPFLAPGHMIPMVDLAKLFAARPGVKATIITTVPNAPLIEPAIAHSSDPIQLLTLPFPPSAPTNVAHLPTPDLTPEFVAAIDTLKDPFAQLMAEHRPDCIISDIFYPWSADLAVEHNIPRLAFHGSCAFSIVVIGVISTLKPDDNIADDDTPFVIPNIPHRIQMLKTQIPGHSKTQPDEILLRVIESYKRTYGTIMNTFAALEAEYVGMLRSKAWLVGPVFNCNRDTRESAARGGKELRNFDVCTNWLDSKKPGTVLYVCFGSLGRFVPAQLREVAVGLADCNHPFVWVVRNAGDMKEWMPEELEERVAAAGKGLIVREWAPQMVILNHPSVGGFMTHCGWNSCLEGVTAGLPMVTWPQFAEQFFNERLMVDVLRVGVSVGAKVCSGPEEKRTEVKGEEVTKAVNAVMGDGEEADGRRRRTKEVAEMARRATEEGGTSYMDMSRLIEELMDLKKKTTENSVSS